MQCKLLGVVDYDVEVLRCLEGEAAVLWCLVRHRVLGFHPSLISCSYIQDFHGCNDLGLYMAWSVKKHR